MIRYAPFLKRIYAFLLDYVIVLLYGIFIVGSMAYFFSSFFTPLFTNSPVTAQITGFLVMTLPVSLYFILCDCSKWQGTWGKRKMGLRVNHEGQRIGLIRSIIRTGIKFLPWEIAHFAVIRLIISTHHSEDTLIYLLISVNIVIILYLIVPLTNPQRKNIYDWVAGTTVSVKK